MYPGGIHATGVSAIVRRSDTERKVFYMHSESSDSRVSAALERRDELWFRIGCR
jgi:hypothetical protein